MYYPAFIHTVQEVRTNYMYIKLEWPLLFFRMATTVIANAILSQPTFGSLQISRTAPTHDNSYSRQQQTVQQYGAKVCSVGSNCQDQYLFYDKEEDEMMSLVFS